jgi:hypothetical protein
MARNVLKYCLSEIGHMNSDKYYAYFVKVIIVDQWRNLAKRA